MLLSSRLCRTIVPAAFAAAVAAHGGAAAAAVVNLGTIDAGAGQGLFTFATSGSDLGSSTSATNHTLNFGLSKLFATLSVQFDEQGSVNVTSVNGNSAIAVPPDPILAFVGPITGSQSVAFATTDLKSGADMIFRFTGTVVPLPAALPLLLSALGGLWGLSRWRRRPSGVVPAGA